MADHDTHDHTGIPGCGAPTDIVDIPTAETDASLVLAPDGVGGVEFRAESGAGGGGLTLLEQHTGNNTSPNLDFTSFISGTYDEYLFELVNVLPATDDTQFRMIMGTGGGPTYDTGANYGWNVFISRAAASATNGADSGQNFIGFNYQAGGTLGVSNSANHGGVNGSVRLFDPGSALYKNVHGTIRIRDAEPAMLNQLIGGMYLSTTAVTAIRFLFSSGNVASGTIRAYGIAK